MANYRKLVRERAQRVARNLLVASVNPRKPGMAQRVSSWIGWAALAAFAVTGLYAWAQAKQHITITVSQGVENPTGASDTLLVMQDDLATLRLDLQALSQSIGGALDASHSALESSASHRDGTTQEAIAALGSDLRAMSARVEALQHGLEIRLGALETDRRIQTPPGSVGQDMGSPAQTSAISNNRKAAPESTQELESAPGLEAAGNLSRDGLGHELATGGATSGAALAVAEGQGDQLGSLPNDTTTRSPQDQTKGFLSFQLPSQRFDYAALQRFVVLPGLSRVGFDAKSTLHDFSGTSQSIRGEWSVRLSQPAQGLSGFVSVLSKSLNTQNSARDEEMLKLLAVQQAPELDFQIKSYVPEGEQGMGPTSPTLRGNVLGTMTIKGKSRELSMSVRLRLDESKRLVVEGETELALSDYGVEAPNKLGVISMNDRVRIWIALRARCVGPAIENQDAR